MWPWNPGQGSLKIIENYTIRSGTHAILLTFHSSHRPISYPFRDKVPSFCYINCATISTVNKDVHVYINSDFRRKSPIFPTTRLFNAAAEGVPLRIGYRRSGQKKLEWWGLIPEGRKSFMIGLAVYIPPVSVLIQYRPVTDRHPVTQ